MKRLMRIAVSVLMRRAQLFQRIGTAGAEAAPKAGSRSSRAPALA